MSYLDKINVNGTDYDLGALESLKDQNGNSRFVEGNLTTSTISNITFTYKKWSLSGTHLMLVLAFKVDSATTINAYTDLGYANIPSWVMNKIYTISSNTNRVTVNEFKSTSQYGASDVSFNLALNKDTNNNRLYVQNTESAVSLNANTYVRIQFDLLIDTD